MIRIGTLACAVLGVAIALGLTGCEKPARTKPPAAAQANAPAAPQAGQPEPERKEARTAGEIIGNAAQNIRQGAVRQGNKAMLHDLGLFFQHFHNENGRPPKNKDEFITYIKRDAPKAVEALREETYIVRWNTPMSSNNVLVYERYALPNGTRLVLKGDGSVHTMTEAEFQDALKASGK